MKRGLIYLVVLLSFIRAQSQVDPIWKAYYDSTDLTWGYDWEKTAELLIKAKEHLEISLPEYNLDSTYNLTLEDLGKSFFQLHNYSKAKELYEQVLQNTEIIKGRLNADFGMRLSYLAASNYKLGNYESAQRLYLESIEICKATLGENHPDYSYLLNDCATFYQELGRYEEAFPMFTEALENTIRSFGKSHSSYATRLNNLGLLNKEMGRYDEALKLYKEALNVLEKNYGEKYSGYATYLNNLAGVLREMGRYEDALTYSLRAVEVAESNYGTEHLQYGMHLYNLGMLNHLMGHNEDAYSIASEALEITGRTEGKDHWHYGTRLRLMGMVSMERLQNEDALSYLLEAKENLSASVGSEHDEYGHVANDLVVLYRRMGRYDEAVSVMSTANDNMLGQIDRVFGISSEKNKEDFFQTLEVRFQNYQSMGYDGSYQFAKLNDLLYDNELLFKGLVLNSTKNAIAAIRESGDSVLSEKFTKWKNMRQRLAKGHAKSIATSNIKLDSLEAIANQLEGELMMNSNAFAKARRQVKWIEIRDVLRKNEIAIEFVHFNYSNKKTTDSIIYAAMVITPACKQPDIIPLFELTALTEFLGQGASQPSGQAINYFYRGAKPLAAKANYNELKLYELIWQPVQHHLKGKKIIYYAPSGQLHQIAHVAIPHPEGGNLMDHFRMIQLNSTRDLVMDHAVPLLDPVVLYGGIDYDYLLKDQDVLRDAEESLEQLVSSRSSLMDRFSPLDGAQEEVKKIASLFAENKIEVEIKTSKDATEADVKALSGNSPKILHIATHGFFFPDNDQLRDGSAPGSTFKSQDNPMMRSGLILANANYAWQHGSNPYEDEDGILTAYEISNLDLSNTDLVVLSACETGLGDIRGSEGVFGLQRAFKMAGVDYLIMSLWQVPDEQTTLLMELFYSNWLEGMSIREAFRAAQHTLSEKHSPYNWAAFILVGGGKEESLSASSRGRRIFWGFAIFALALIAGWVIHRKIM